MTLKEKFNKQLLNKGTIVAFNIQNLYQLQSLYKVANQNQVHVIAQFSAKFIKYFDDNIGFEMLVKKYQNEFLTFHLDHCLDISLIKFCIDKGFASVMFDGSALPLLENIKLSNEIYDYAHQKGCLLEVELGSISGVEDGFGEEHGLYYDIEELKKFNESTKYDLLALAIGNAHGIYQSLDSIKLELLEDAKRIVGEQFFVLHGGTGMPETMIRQAIDIGVVKMNVSTALKVETLNIMKNYSNINTSYDEIKFGDFFYNSISPFYLNYIANYTK
ncbi:class II fructose-bisphosphate aldolase [Emticicia sp. SJ17W-69]|uniref:class II fructose-bisphosphate aldolase n=1 Tax=Emticicia sp. SJ17W-69 TaxID=3421657 RepID=UPI003EBB24DD